MSIDEIIGRNLRLFREKMHLSQERLSEILDINRVTISQYETGSRAATIRDLEKIAHFFGVEEADLMEENFEDIAVKIAFAFRADALTDVDFKSIAMFKEIVFNHIRLKKLAQKHEIQSI